MKTLLRFQEFVEELGLNNSSNYKKEVLAKYKDDEDVKFMLHYVFNPYIVNGISKGKLAKKFDNLPDIELSCKEVLETVAEMRTGSDEAVKIVKGFMKKLNAKQKELFSRVVSKNLPLGVGVLTINKVMGNIIPTFNVMLAAKYEDNIDYVKGKEFTLTRKIDGSRIVMLKDEGVVKFYTRAGQLYEGLIELEQDAIKNLPDNIMLDGELTLMNAEGLDSAEQYKKTMMITRRNGIKTGLKMLVFDAMPVADFYLENCPIPYIERRKLLQDIFSSSQPTFFELLPVLYQGSDMTQIERVLNEQVEKGEEGIMLNLNDGLYSFNRTKDLLKVKKMHDVDLEIIRIESGSNSNEDKLGAFVVNYKGHEVRVGSGIDKETREKVWANPDEYIGRVIRVQYFEETTNQQGGVSLRFPVFLGFRDDKEGDY